MEYMKLYAFTLSDHIILHFEYRKDQCHLRKEYLKGVGRCHGQDDQSHAARPCLQQTQSFLSLFIYLFIYLFIF